jgi:hypothetical protein
MTLPSQASLLPLDFAALGIGVKADFPLTGGISNSKNTHPPLQV